MIGYDVLPKRRQAHRRAGGLVAPSCRAVGDQVGLLVCSLPSSEALRQTAAELARCRRPPQCVIDTSTLPIAVKQEDAQEPCGARHDAARLSVERNRRAGAGEGSRGLRQRRPPGVSPGGPGARRVRARPLLRRRVRRRVEDEVRGEPARRRSQCGRRRSARARHEGRPGSCDGREGDRRRRRKLAHVPGARSDDGEGRLLRTRR